MEILKPTPDEALKMNDYYTLQTTCDSKIKPQVLAKKLCLHICFPLFFGQKIIQTYILSLAKIFQFTSCQSLKLTPNKTNFFDLHIKDEMECLELSIMTKEGQKIWEVNIESGKQSTRTCKTLCRSDLYLLYSFFFLCYFR